MPKITYYEPSGEIREVEVANGLSIMEGAVGNMVDGITADCGGACSCATCHVHVDPDWFEKTGGPSDMEAELLDFSDNRCATSRLGCQIEVSDALDGMVVRIPDA